MQTYVLLFCSVFVNPGYSNDADLTSESTAVTTVTINSTTGQLEDEAKPQSENSPPDDSNVEKSTSDVANSDSENNTLTEKQPPGDSNVLVTGNKPTPTLVGDDPTDKDMVFQNPSVVQPINTSNSSQPPAASKKKGSMVRVLLVLL